MARRRDETYEFKFKLPKLLQYSVVSLRGVPRNWEKARESLLQSPKSLVVLAGQVVDSQPLPECMYWTTDDVEDWIKIIIGLPQYRVCFRNNFIQGRHLILLDPNTLVRLSVFRFDHIKRIMLGIRELFKVPMPLFARDLTLPNIHGTTYDWLTLYYCHVSHQSPDQATPRTVYWRRVGLLNALGQTEYTCHWHTISADTGDTKVRVGRYIKKDSKNYYTPMFREGNFVPIQKIQDYFFMDPYGWGQSISNHSIKRNAVAENFRCSLKNC